jgi:5-methylcytosine-specific restriction endonuclease McrA
MTKKERKYLDDLWAKKVKEIGECQRCHTGINLQAHHIISRANKVLRWDIKNGIPLCARDHLWWAHQSGSDYPEWIKQHCDWDYLQSKKRNILRADFELIKLSLK